MPYLAFNLNDVNEFVFDILEERLSIGRDAKNDIVIDNTYISGSHAEFLRKPDGVYELVDLKSANGTFVNGRRIQRSLVKGGDKIRFGQLDARFREQAPKGTAPASGSKPSSQPKASPAHSDGRRGDTEPKRDTSSIEPARSFQTLREGAAAAAPSAGSLSIAIPSSATLDLALLKQREKLAAEVRRLRQERDLLRSETENQIRLREEVRAMESSLDERRKEAQAADARLAETRAATMEYANRYSIINSAADARLAETRAAIATAQAEAEKLASKKRDVADLDSQIESKRTQLSKVQADIETANTAFQSLHTDADKARNDRLEAEKQLADLHTQIQQHEAKSSELEAIFNTAQKQKQSDLATLEAKLQANQAEKEQLDKTLAELSQPNQQLQAQATDLTNKQDDLAGTDVKLGEANTALKAVESNEAELTAAISQMVVKRDSLAREILSSTEKSRAQNTLLQTLTVRRGAVDAEVRSSEEQQASLSAEISKARESLRATETTLETRKQELATAESRAAQFTQQAEESVRQQTQIQQEIAQVRGELVKEQAELQQIRTDTQNAMTAAEEAEAAHARHSSQAVAMQTQISGLETLLATLLTSQTDRQTNLVALEAEQRRCEDGLNLRELEVSKADARLAELKAQTANYESRLSELASMEKNLAETKAAWIAAGQEQESLKIEAERLQRERADHEKRLLDLQTELVNAQSELKTQLIELETSQASAKELAERVSALEDLETQLIQAEKRLEEVRRDITLQMTERDGVSALVLTLFSQRAEHENLLPKLRADVQVLKTELQTLTQDKNSIMVALERVQADRHAALEQTESLLAESANLQERLTEKRDTLEAEIKARLAETNQAEARLIEITAKVAASEKRVSDLAVAQEQLTECQNALKETEVRRHAEEKALAELVKQQDRLRNELFTLEDGIRAGTGAVNDLTTKIKSYEARSADASARLKKATTTLHTTESKRAEAEAAAAKTRNEENALRKAIPALNAELTGLQAVLSKLACEREEVSQHVTRLNVSTDEGNKRIASLQQQISQLEEAQRVHEERVMKSHVEADLEAGRLKAAQEKTRAAENSLQAIKREVKDIRLKVDATRTQLAGLESDLRARLDRIETLKLEEDHLLKELAARKSTIASTESVLAELRDKTHQEEKRVSEFTHIGGQILSFGASLADLQSRQEETARSLREASEREFALQMKINSLQETSNREAARVEEIRQERLRVEKDFNTFNNTAQKQKASMQVIEAEQRKRLAEAERQLQGQLSQTEHLKQELAGLQDRRAEFA